MRQRTWKSIKAREPDDESGDDALGGSATSAPRARESEVDAKSASTAETSAETSAHTGDAPRAPNDAGGHERDDRSDRNDRADTTRARRAAPRAAGVAPPNSWRFRANPTTFAPRIDDPPDTSALSTQIVQAVSFANAETASYAASQIATDADMLISQTAALASQSALSYFDGVSKLALSSQAVLITEMTKSLAKGAAGAEDALVQGLGVLATDIMVAAAAAVAAATGAMEGEAASFAMDKIDQSISKYAELLDRSKGASGGG